jgi:uncharacterized metal-binding protein
MQEQNANAGDKPGYNMVFACSGAADVGAVTDQAARKLAGEKTAAMCCTAAIAAGIPQILEKAAGASKLLVLDGCDQACAKKIMDQGGFSDYAYVELGAMGMEKGKTPVIPENIATTADAARKALTAI